MVAFRNHVNKVRPQPLQINNLAPDLKLALHQSIVAVEIHDRAVDRRRPPWEIYR